MQNGVALRAIIQWRFVPAEEQDTWFCMYNTRFLYIYGYTFEETLIRNINIYAQ